MERVVQEGCAWGGIFAYILFMDLLGRWGMQLRRLQTLPYLTNQPFDVCRSEAGCGGACQMKIGAGGGGGREGGGGARTLLVRMAVAFQSSSGGELLR